jgi:hypothetical protein
MVDTPHTGVNVRIDKFPSFLGGALGDDVYERASNRSPSPGEALAHMIRARNDPLAIPYQ